MTSALVRPFSVATAFEVLVLMLSLPHPPGYASRTLGKTIRVDLRFDPHLDVGPVLRVRVNGKGAINVVLDSAFSGTLMIDIHTAERIGLRQLERMEDK